jgi:hypothetical protein
MLSNTAQMRIERVVLEDHRDVAIARRDVVDHAVADQDIAGRDFLEPGDHAQGGRLAAAGRPDQNHEFVVLDLKIDSFNRLHVAVVDLVDLADRNLGHCVFPCVLCRRLVNSRQPLVAPAVRPEM